ncbi:TPA: phage replisome organizer N-terminal domain-containing protein [Streptococcus suis]|nr:phage replisome organizer N-terminal domain-containing protein [Streptococcus suis]
MALTQNKRYYWLQLKEDFFASKEMKLLRRLPGGDEHTIIYLKIMLASLQDSGKIYFENLGNDLAEEIALLIDEDVEAVRMTLLFLTNKKLLTTKDKFEFQLEQVPELIGSETASTRRSRKHREMQKALQCNTDATERNGDIEIEKEIDINIELEVDTVKTATDTNIYDYYQQRIGSLDGFQYEKLKEYLEIEHFEPELVKRAIDKAADGSKRYFNYINSILTNWAKNDIRTVARQDEEQRQFVDSKANKQKSNDWVPDPNYPPPY